MSRIGIWMFLGGALLIVVALNEAKQSSAGARQPQVITCAKLVEEGYGNNAHVRMTDFHLCEYAYVYEEKIRWTKAWVPAVPVGSSIHKTMLAHADGRKVAPAPRGPEIKVIVLLPKARSERDVTEAAKRKFIQGLMIKPLQLLTRSRERLLAESYPGLDFNECMILVEGRQPSSKGKTIAITSIGTALVVAAILLMAIAWRRKRQDAWITVDKR